MKFYESFFDLNTRQGMKVCGDQVRTLHAKGYTVMVLCDGIGSGIYANIAAITCAERLCELMRDGISFRAACCTVADSMHRAHTENIPYAAFSAVKVLDNGNFSAYNFDAPPVIKISGHSAAVLQPEYIQAGMEKIGTHFGHIEEGDMLVLMSDGVTQAGLGNGYNLGIGSEGIRDYLDKLLPDVRDPAAIGGYICRMARNISGLRYVDDTSVAVLFAREAEPLSIATGPPQKHATDNAYVEEFMASPGKHIVCGSTTADIVSRILGRDVAYVNPEQAGFGMPPEYHIEGIDMVTEGAMMLNQVYNILDVPLKELTGDSVVERLCVSLLKADIITFFHGHALNDAHSDMIFKQVGVRSRQTIINLMAKKLETMGKLVIINNY